MALNIEVLSGSAVQAEALALHFWPHYNAQASIDWSYSRHAFVARRGESTCGVLVYSISGGVAHLGQVIVDPHCQRQGLGTRLVKAFEEAALAQSCHKLTLEVAEFQTPLFFERLGFRRTATYDGDRFGATWYRYDKAGAASVFAKKRPV